MRRRIHACVICDTKVNQEVIYIMQDFFFRNMKFCCPAVYYITLQVTYINYIA